MAKTAEIDRVTSKTTSKTKLAVVKKAPKPDKLMQAQIDDFIAKTKQKNKLEKELKELRPFIEEWIEVSEQAVIKGSTGGTINKIATSRPQVTSRYTYYDAEIIVAELPMDIARKCIVEVVDKNIVDAFITLGVIDEDVAGAANTSKSSFNYTVK